MRRAVAVFGDRAWIFLAMHFVLSTARSAREEMHTCAWRSPLQSLSARAHLLQVSSQSSIEQLLKQKKAALAHSADATIEVKSAAAVGVDTSAHANVLQADATHIHPRNRGKPTEFRLKHAHGSQLLKKKVTKLSHKRGHESAVAEKKRRKTQVFERTLMCVAGVVVFLAGVFILFIRKKSFTPSSGAAGENIAYGKLVVGQLAWKKDKKDAKWSKGFVTEVDPKVRVTVSADPEDLSVRNGTGVGWDHVRPISDPYETQPKKFSQHH